MNINMALIANFLQINDNVCKLPESTNLNIEHVVTEIPHALLDDSYVVILSVNELYKLDTDKAPRNIILACSIDEDLSSLTNNAKLRNAFFVPAFGWDKLQILTTIYNRKSLLDDWEARMRNAFYTQASYPDIFELLVEMFPNPVIFQTAYHSVVLSAGHTPDTCTSEVWNTALKTGRAPYGDNDVLSASREFAKTHGTLRMQFPGIDTYETMACNLVVGGQFAGELDSIDINAPFTESDRCIFDYFRCNLERYIAKSPIGGRGAAQESFLHDIITESINMPTMYEIAREQNIDPEGSFLLLTFISSSNFTYNEPVQESLYFEARRLFIDSIVVKSPDMTVALVPWDKQRDPSHCITAEVEHMLTYYDSIMCVSSLFHELSFAYIAFKQNTYAMKYASTHAKGRVLLYEECFAEDVVNKLADSEDDIAYFVHPAITLLHRIDCSQDKSYVHDLLVYLQCGQSKTDAAHALHIHYNTLVYRLGKIEEITGLSVASGFIPRRQLFAILLSCLLVNHTSK